MIISAEELKGEWLGMKLNIKNGFIKRECPLCKGKKYLTILPYHDNEINLKKFCAIALIKSGYSYRQIMKFLNYKSPRSVSVLLNA